MSLFWHIEKECTAARSPKIAARFPPRRLDHKDKDSTQKNEESPLPVKRSVMLSC